MSLSVLFYGRVDELLALLSGRNEQIELDRAALVLAGIEYPHLESGPFLSLLDSYARELAERLDPAAGGAEYVRAANEYLFQELGFRGNQQNYYDPRNSCLNEVLTSRTGIPITLSVVYLEISRRLAKPVYGIGLPGHFLVQFNDGRFSTFIDPFHGGTLLSATDCFRLAKKVTRVDLVQDPLLLAPVTKRQILLRMANNLRGIYFSRRVHSKALQVLDLLLTANPDSAEEYKQRGLVHLQTRNITAAKADLERYLSLAPDAPDHEEIRKQAHALRQYLAGMN